LEEKDRFMEKLNKLMDIVNCKCYIKSCTDVVATLSVLVKYTYLEEYEDIMEESVTDYYNEYIDKDKNYLPGESEASDNFAKTGKRAR